MNCGDIKKIAVLGAGTMGPGIAQIYAMGGFEVSLYTRSEATLEKARAMLKTNVETFIEETLLTPEEAERALERITFTRDLQEAVRGAQFVQETVAEKPDIKAELFSQIDKMMPEDAIIVSNASSLNPFLLVPERRLPYCTTAHWYAPPQIIPLVEVAKCDSTHDSTVDTVMRLLHNCGKSPVRMEKFVPGYIINRIQILLNTEVFYLLENGVCTPEMLDRAVKASLMSRGMVLGLVQRYDFTGLDISANNIVNASYVMPETSRRPPALFDHVDRGELGIKTGKGFYDYDGRSVKELCKRRDKQLFRVYRALGDLINDHI